MRPFVRRSRSSNRAGARPMNAGMFDFDPFLTLLWIRALELARGGHSLDRFAGEFEMWLRQCRPRAQA